MSEANTENKKTASERLEIVENTVNSLIQAVQPMANMAQDLMALREAVKLLNNKLDAVVKCTNAGSPLTDENLNQVMTQNNAKELEDRVSKMVSDGLLAATDVVQKDSFVVINEADSNGKIVNPRMQFLLSALQNEEIKGKLEGATVGANVPVGESGASLNVLEIYNIVVPNTPEASETQETAPQETSALPESASTGSVGSAPADTAAPQTSSDTAATA